MAGFTIANATEVNVTIWDEQGTELYEDNETEPRTMKGNDWDFEMATMDGNTLSLYGTWDFLNGIWLNGSHYSSGDLFFNIGAPNDGTSTRWTWDYAIDVNWGTKTYVIYKGINKVAGSTVSFDGYSNPFEYIYDPAHTVLATGNMGYGTVSDGYMGLSLWPGYGGNTTHNRVSFDISSIVNDPDRSGKTVFGHWTQSCGNDDGDWTVPDGGMTLILLGAGLSALAMLRRRLA